TVAASLIDALFRVAFNAQTTQAAQQYGGRISHARLARAVKQGQLAYSMIVDGSGRVLGSAGRAPKAPDRAVIRAALRNGVGLSGVKPGRTPVVESAVAFRARRGVRLQVNGSPLKVYQAFL